LNKKLLGIALSVAIGLLAYWLAPMINYVNAVLLSFLIGVCLNNVLSLPKSLSSGIKFSASKVLEFSIELLAFNINFNKIADLGASKFVLVVIMIVLLILLTIFLAKKLNCPTESGWLVGFGTAICGSSAIAALAPSVTKNTEDTGIAIAIVNLIGSMGMILMPFIFRELDLSDTEIASYIGAGLHSVGNVAGAGFEMSERIGENALTIKMARVAMLSPAIIFFNILIQAGKKKNLISYLKLPIYLWAFIAITILVSVVQLPNEFLENMKNGGSILLIIAMAAIGLKVSFRQLIDSGQKAMKFGLLIFVIQLVIISLLLVVL